jgi:glycosyltransferase involved in cell wall biosynthesis
MQSVLIVTPCSRKALPSQGLFIAEELRKAGVNVQVLASAESGLGRLLDVISRGMWLIPRYDRVFVNVYAERAFTYESFAILYARLWRKHLVVLLHNGRMIEFIRRWSRWVSLVLSQADRVLVPHLFLQEQLTGLGFRIDGTIPNFIDLKKYRFRERTSLTPHFLYLRGMESYYNPEMAIRAFRLIQNEYPDALLTMAGPEGSESALCRRLGQDLKLRNVYFVGLVPKDQIAELAEQHDIHLHTNRVENMPVTIIEMWACGLPIVGTEAGGMPYLVRNGIDGILVKSDDYLAMAQACLKLLSDKEIAGTLSRNGRKRAEELTWESIMPAWEKALLLDGNSPPSALASAQKPVS